MPFSRHRTLGRIHVVAAVLVLFAGISAHAQTTLEWKFSSGQVFKQVISQETKSTAAVGSQNIETNMNQTLDVVWKIAEVDDQKVATVEAEITRIRVKISNVGMNLDFDSEAEVPQEGVAAMLAPAFKAMVNAKFTLKVDPRGKVLDSTISQETLDTLKSLPNMGPMSQMINKDTLVSMVQQGMVTLPEEPVEKGDSWTDTMEIDLPQIGTMKANTKLTYEGPEELDGKTLQRVSMQLTSDITPAAGGMFKITLKDQSSSGVLYFDAEGGRISHSELKQQMTMSMEVAGNQIEQKMDQTIKATLQPAAGAQSAPNSSPGVRTWSDASGTYRVVAQFIAVTDGKVTLRKQSGELIEVPLDRLSDADKAYVAEIQDR
jgi:hypothetical protein